MSDIQRLIKMLQSNNPDQRYDACEELRVSPLLPPEALEALRLVTNDVNPDVADAARRAIALHSANKDMPQTNRTNNEPGRVGKINNFKMEKKNPLIAGLLNILIPGLGHLYLGQWPGCILWFFGYAVVGAIVSFVASFFVGSLGDRLPGLPIIVLGLLFAAMLFNDAFTFAKRHNEKLGLAIPETKKPEEQGDIQAKLKKLQEMHIAGLITQEDYERKKTDILSRL